MTSAWEQEKTGWETENEEEFPEEEAHKEEVRADGTGLPQAELGKVEGVSTEDIPSPPKLGYEVKAYLVLLDSDKDEQGLIEDTLNNLLWEPGKGEVVGTWSRPRYDNRIHISLTTAINALSDRAIQTFKYYDDQLKSGKPKVVKTTTGTKKVRKLPTESTGEAPTPTAANSAAAIDTSLQFNSLRAKLGRVK